MATIMSSALFLKYKYVIEDLWCTPVSWKELKRSVPASGEPHGRECS
jgi:hypothetical protein